MDWICDHILKGKVMITNIEPKEAAMLRRAFEAFMQSPAAIHYTGKIHAIAEIHGLDPTRTHYDASAGVLVTAEDPALVCGKPPGG